MLLLLLGVGLGLGLGQAITQQPLCPHTDPHGQLLPAHKSLNEWGRVRVRVRVVP